MERQSPDLWALVLTPDNQESPESELLKTKVLQFFCRLIWGCELEFCFFWVIWGFEVFFLIMSSCLKAPKNSLPAANARSACSARSTAATSSTKWWARPCLSRPTQTRLWVETDAEKLLHPYVAFFLKNLLFLLVFQFLQIAQRCFMCKKLVYSTLVVACSKFVPKH